MRIYDYVLVYTSVLWLLMFVVVVVVVVVLRMRVFASGVLVVQSLSHSEEAVIKHTAKLVSSTYIYHTQIFGFLENF